MNNHSPNIPSLQAMQAGRAYLEKKPPGARRSNYRQVDAARDYDSTPRMVRKAVKLLNSGRDDLIRGVEEEGKALSDVENMLKRGEVSRNTQGGQYLYLITEGFKGSKWSKIGVGDLPVRFDEAQRGNPRKLRLAGAWWFPSDTEAQKVEDMIKKDISLPKAPGGNEWRKGMPASYVNEIAISKDGRRSLPPEFNQMGFRRLEGSNQQPKTGIAKQLKL